MASSDKIKDALVASFPNTSAKDWKRRSKTKDENGTHREFEHPDHGTVSTTEAPDGTVTVPTLSEKITETGRAILREVSDRFQSLLQQPGGDDIFTIVPSPPIEKGTKVQIAAGTEIFDLSYGNDANGSSISTRATTATVKRQMVMDKQHWLSFAPKATREKIEAIMTRVSGRSKAGSSRHLLYWIKSEQEERGMGQRVFSFSRNAEIAQALIAAQAEVLALYGENPEFVVWGSGSNERAVLRQHATVVASKAEATAVPPKEATITKRRMMVEKSKWRFTRNVELHMWVKNPKIDELATKRSSIQRSNNSQHRSGNAIVITLGGGQGNTASEEAEMAEIQNQINALVEGDYYVRVHAATVKAGTVFTVTGKLAAGYVSYQQPKNRRNGLMIPASIDSGSIDLFGKQVDWHHPLRAHGAQIGLPYNQVEDAVEADSVPEAIVYVLRDRKTGEFFGGWESEHDGNYNRQSNAPKMSKTFSGSKKYATSSAVKASIRDFTGYNDGINDDGEYAPEWASGGQKKIDLPATWEMVAIDKTTNNEKEIIEVQDWFKGLMKLRVLTQKHCSAVRSVYKKAQESTEPFEAILLFQNREVGSATYNNGNSSTWDHATPWENEIDEGKSKLAAITKAAGMMGGKSLRTKTQSAVAYASSLEDGMLAKLSFNSQDVITRLLDINTLEDIVESGETVAKPITRTYNIGGEERSY